MTDLRDAVLQIEGPIVVTGAAGFIGSNLMAELTRHRADVVGLSRSADSWRQRAAGLPTLQVCPDRTAVLTAIRTHAPATVFNLAAYGAYSFQADRERMLDVNFRMVGDISDWATMSGACIVQAGSSSEYGWNSDAPDDDAVLRPNSMYAVTKAAAANWLSHQSRVGALDSCTLRLYSVYGPLEDASRLFPALIRSGLDGTLPPFAAPDTSRDFVYVADVVRAFIAAGGAVRSSAKGLDIPICTGTPTTMRDIADIASREFGLNEDAVFGEITREWDLPRWVGDPSMAKRALDWTASVSVGDGLHATREWYEAPGRLDYLSRAHSVREQGTGSVSVTRSSEPDISAVVACYRDADAMPFMYERVRQTMAELGLDFELIFVNDASPDDAVAVVERLSEQDPRVVGITHSRNFGSQSAFLSGMRLARGKHVVLMDGDLQDPPELIAQMWATLESGYDVVYGHRIDREASWIMRRAYKSFYRVFDALAPFKIPRDAGDFSLMTRAVVDVLVSMPEQDLFLRAQRAYLGFRQTGVDYVRPERMFGTSTNNIRRNFGWATRGVLAVSRAPLTALSLFALGLFLLSLLLIVLQIGARVFFPDIAPQGLTSLSVLVLGLGALNLLAVAIVGEYVGRILEETKRRPRFITRSVTENGTTTPVDRWDRNAVD